MYVTACYFSYLAISIALTIWVARTLHSSGRVFLIDAFHGTMHFFNILVLARMRKNSANALHA